MQDGQPGQLVVQTLVRFWKHAWCVGITADRAGNIYAAMRESIDKHKHLLQLKPGTNELVQLPLRLDLNAVSIAVSPSGQELYEGTGNGRILVHRAPWADRAGEVLSPDHRYCINLGFCDNRYVLWLVHAPSATSAQ